MTFFFTSESVSAGHPDKIADQISDAILDAILAQDKDARVAAETLVSENLVVLAGELSTSASIDFDSVVREMVKSLGYNSSSGFDYKTIDLLIKYRQQSPDIAMGVNNKKFIGAGDQGIMFGYASNETQEYMPLPISLAHRLMKRHSCLRQDGRLPWLGPDAKCQVTVAYSPSGVPLYVSHVLLSTQHAPDISHKEIEEAVIEMIIRPVLTPFWIRSETLFFINPTGRFVIGGPAGDCGLTGRKTIVDTYGGFAPHGGGAFSGKDPTKVDRSATYAARYIAKNIIAAGLAQKCLIQLAYAIGICDPISIMVDTYGTGVIPDQDLVAIIKKNCDLSVSGMINTLSLLRPIYKKTAAYGHFGRDEPEFLWESLDLSLTFLKAKEDVVYQECESFS